MAAEATVDPWIADVFKKSGPPQTWSQALRDHIDTFYLAPMAKHGLAVRVSSIAGAGYGVFATRDIKDGTLLCRYEGEVLQKCKSYALYGGKDAAPPAYLCCWVQRGVDIDAKDPEKGGLGRMFNNKPNGNNARLTEAASIRANRKIRAGEEIFIPYGVSYGEMGSETRGKAFSAKEGRKFENLKRRRSSTPAAARRTATAVATATASAKKSASPNPKRRRLSAS